MNKQEQRIVYIKAVTPERLLPDDVLSELKLNIGSKFDRGTQGLLMGLSYEERLVILPNVLKVSPDDAVHWMPAVEKFYSDLTIRVPFVEGLRLNIATHPVKHKMKDGTDIKIDYPVAPMDYIKYKQCLVDNSVANTPDLIEEGTYSFYIVDEEQDAAREALTMKSTIKIDNIFGKLVELDSNDDYKYKNTIRYVSRILGKNPDAETNFGKIVNFIKELKDEAIREVSYGVEMNKTLFVSTVGDKKIKEKAFILECLDEGLLKRDGDYIVDGDDFNIVYGKNLSQAVKFIESIENQSKLISLKRRLKGEELQEV